MYFCVCLNLLYILCCLRVFVFISLSLNGVCIPFLFVSSHAISCIHRLTVPATKHIWFGVPYTRPRTRISFISLFPNLPHLISKRICCQYYLKANFLYSPPLSRGNVSALNVTAYNYIIPYNYTTTFG